MSAHDWQVTKTRSTTHPTTSRRRPGEPSDRQVDLARQQLGLPPATSRHLPVVAAPPRPPAAWPMSQAAHRVIQPLMAVYRDGHHSDGPPVAAPPERPEPAERPRKLNLRNAADRAYLQYIDLIQQARAEGR